MRKCSLIPRALAQGQRESRNNRRNRKPCMRQFKLNASEIDDFNERAAILEFDGGLARDAAEARALVIILAGRRRRTSAV